MRMKIYITKIFIKLFSKKLGNYDRNYDRKVPETYIMVPSSAALQNMKGTLGQVAILLTRPTWQLNSCVVSWVWMSCTLILQSAAPVTIVPSLEWGKNCKENSIRISLLRDCLTDIPHIFMNKMAFFPNYLHREYIPIMLGVYCSQSFMWKWIPNYHMHIVRAWGQQAAKEKGKKKI